MILKKWETIRFPQTNKFIVKVCKIIVKIYNIIFSKIHTILDTTFIYCNYFLGVK